jgi:ADP-heptose:LPS heptosyltransferase
LHIFTAFLSKVDLHFSYDNGPKHLAIAVGTATLSLFATDPPYLWNPIDDPNHPYILADVPCKFCRLTKCPLMICMKQIEPETILTKIEGIEAIREKLKIQKISRQDQQD